MKRTLTIFLACGIALIVGGCKEFDVTDFELPSLFKDEKAIREEKAIEALTGKEGHSKYIGDYIAIGGDTVRQVQGVGLVTRLNGNGEDIPASHMRKMLIEDLRRMQIEGPEALLASPDTALVLVTAFVPPLLKKGERFDIEVMIPDGHQAKSLAGGWLMPCRLSEYAYVEGDMREGKELAESSGPILLLQGDKNSPSSVRKGTIPGGAVYRGDDRNLMIGLRKDYRSAKMTYRIAKRIGDRFHGYDKGGIKKAMATAKTDAMVELKVQDLYINHYPRYLQVIRHMRLSESAIDRHLRLVQLKDELLNDVTCERAALELEGVGPDAIPTLKEGLRSPLIEVRFRASEALAYLGNASGVEALKESADKEPAFRAFALAALSTLDDGHAQVALKELMHHESVETRYGAFRALSTAAPHDPDIAGKQFEQRFSVHLFDSKTTPLIHLTKYQKAEIVIFGDQQRVSTPLVLRAGRSIILKSTATGDRIMISKIKVDEEPVQQEVSTRVADIVMTLGEMGAGYPEIVEMLVQADKQHNLPGEIGIDALPRAGRTYLRPTFAGSTSTGTETTVGGQGTAPNLFESPNSAPTLTPEAKEVEEQIEKMKAEKLRDEAAAKQAESGTGTGAGETL